MAISEELAFASIGTLGEKLRAGEFSCVELTEFFLKRCETIGPKLNAVVLVCRKQALQQAAKLDQELRAGNDLGPLHGIPCGVKDLLATRDLPTSWGAAPYREQMIDLDATVIVRLRKAGAVLVAKLAMVELAGGFGYRQANASFTGPGLNPWNRNRWAGGSSSGSGSAVGGGIVPFAIGSETWGSIVTPAGYCGITGLRPTYGRVSRHGAMALSWTMDKLGPMAHTAEDCGLILNAIAGPDPNDPTSVPRPYEYPSRESFPEKFRIALLKGAIDNVQPAVRDNFEAARKVFSEFAEFTEIELPDLPYNTVASTLISCEMGAAFESAISSGDLWELTAPEDHWGGHSSLLIPARDYINAMRIRPYIQRAVDELFVKVDAILVPTLSTVAPPIDRSFGEYVRGFTSTSIGAAGNVAGLPAITIPNGFGEENLPTAIELVGRAFEENRLLTLARRYQQQTEFHKQTPNVS